MEPLSKENTFTDLRDFTTDIATDGIIPYAKSVNTQINNILDLI